jgi:linoleoyl-CoA desaturase
MKNMIQTQRIAPKFASNLPEFSGTLRKRVNEYFSINNISTDADFKMVFKTVFYLTFWLGSFALLLTLKLSFPVFLLVYCVYGFSFAASAVNVGHDAIHGAYSKNKLVNKLLSLSFDLNGASSYMWSLMHNTAHHTYTNILNHDEDLHSVPLLRLSPETEYKSVHRHQWWLCFFLYPFATLTWVFRKDFVKMKDNNVANYSGKTHPKDKVIEMFAYKFLYYAVFVVLPFVVIDLPFWQILLGFLSAHFVAGTYLALVFMLAHVVEKVEFPTLDEKGITESNWFIHQLKTTANFGVGSKMAAFISGGLNQQVEHHLFPNICSTHYPAISKIVRDTATEYGVAYNEYPTFWSALQSHVRFLKKLSLG